MPPPQPGKPPEPTVYGVERGVVLDRDGGEVGVRDVVTTSVDRDAKTLKCLPMRSADVRAKIGGLGAKRSQRLEHLPHW